MQRFLQSTNHPCSLPPIHALVPPCRLGSCPRTLTCPWGWMPWEMMEFVPGNTQRLERGTETNRFKIPLSCESAETNQAIQTNISGWKGRAMASKAGQEGTATPGALVMWKLRSLTRSFELPRDFQQKAEEWGIFINVNRNSPRLGPRLICQLSICSGSRGVPGSSPTSCPLFPHPCSLSPSPAGHSLVLHREK